MALNATQKTLLYEILGVPENGASLYVYTIADRFGASADVYDHTGVTARVDTLLAALTATQLVRVIVHLDRYAAIGATSPTIIRDRAGSTPADYPAERAAIKEQLSRLVGVRMSASFNQPGAGYFVAR